MPLPRVFQMNSDRYKLEVLQSNPIGLDRRLCHVSPRIEVLTPDFAHPSRLTLLSLIRLLLDSLRRSILMDASSPAASKLLHQTQLRKYFTQANGGHELTTLVESTKTRE